MSTSKRHDNKKLAQEAGHSLIASDKRSADLFQNSDLPPSSCPAPETLKEAAVLVPLIWEKHAWSILYIVRAENVADRHSGQVAFPGGRRDDSDASIEQTALRELHEEVGIAEEGIQLLGNLPDYITVSDFKITPIVATVPWPSQITMQTAEVARVFSIPLVWLQNQDNFDVRYREEQLQPHNTNRPSVIHYHEFDGELLWGATARMTLNLTHALSTKKIILPEPSS